MSLMRDDTQYVRTQDARDSQENSDDYVLYVLTTTMSGRKQAMVFDNETNGENTFKFFTHSARRRYNTAKIKRRIPQDSSTPTLLRDGRHLGRPLLGH